MLDINRIFYELDDLKALFDITLYSGGKIREPTLSGNRTVSIAHLERKRMIPVSIICEVTKDSAHRVIHTDESKTYIPLSYLVELMGDKEGRVFELSKVSGCIALFPIDSGLTLCDVMIPIKEIRGFGEYMWDL